MTRSFPSLAGRLASRRAGRDRSRDHRRGATKAALAAVALGVVAVFIVPTPGSAASESGQRREAVARVRPEVPVTAMDQGPFGPANNSPLLAADPTEPRFVVIANRLDAPDFDCALQVSGDGGRSWLTVKPVAKLPPGAEKCYAPEVAFDNKGVLHYLFVGLHGAGNEPMGAFLATSADRAQTFGAPRQVLGPLNFAVRMAIDPHVGDKGRLHLVWLHATSDPPLGGFGPPPNPILAAYSDDGGATFSKPVQVSDRSRQRVVAPALALGGDGAVHVAYYDLKDDAVDYQGLEGAIWGGTWSLVVATSTDRGRRFAAGSVVEEAVGPPERVMLIFTMPPPAIVARDDRVCVAWTDGRHGDPDVLLRCSTDAGRSWQRLRRLNDDPVANGRAQYLPRLSVSPDGRIDVVFYDRRNDPKNVLNDVYFSFSADGGETFSPNVRVSQDSFESRIGQQYVHPAARGQFEFGSRLALLSRRSTAVAAWTDTRNSRLVATATGQDIFATTLDVPATRKSTSRAWAPVLAGVIGLAALGSLLATRTRRSRMSAGEGGAGADGA